MTQYNTLNVKLSTLQLNKLKFEIKNDAKVILKISSNAVGDSNDENNFPHKLLLTSAQASKLRKAFANNSSANLKLSKTQLHKIGQSREFLGRLLEPLLKTGLPLIGSVIKPLAKSVLIPLGLTAAASATNVAIHKKMFGSGMTTLIISNEEMNNIIKINKFLEETGLLIKGVSEAIKNQERGKKGGFLSLLLGTLGASLLGNLLAGKSTIRVGKGTVRSGQDF